MFNSKVIKGYDKKEARTFWFYVTPWIIGFLAFYAVPFIASIVLSFMEWDILTPAKWVGLQNYVDMKEDPYFLPAFKNTLYYAAVGVPLGTIGGLLVSLLLFKAVKGINFFRIGYYIPSIFGGVAVVIMWQYLLLPGDASGNNMGLVNTMLSWFGIDGPGWYTSEVWAKPSVLMVWLWSNVTSSIVIWLPALATVPKDLIEAAEIDGASRFRRFFAVMVPYISPIIFFQITTNMINIFKVFNEPLIMPATQQTWTDSLMVNLYQNAFQFFKMGFASAIAWVIVMMILIVTVVNMYVSKKWVHYETN